MIPGAVEDSDDTVPFQIGVAQTGHAVDHFRETGHVYAQDIETQEVWDFHKVSEVQMVSREMTTMAKLYMPNLWY